MLVAVTAWVTHSHATNTVSGISVCCENTLQHKDFGGPDCANNLWLTAELSHHQQLQHFSTTVKVLDVPITDVWTTKISQIKCGIPDNSSVLCSQRYEFLKMYSTFTDLCMNTMWTTKLNFTLLPSVHRDYWFVRSNFRFILWWKITKWDVQMFSLCLLNLGMQSSRKYELCHLN